MASETIGGAQAQAQARAGDGEESGGVGSLGIQIFMIVLGIIASVLAIITLRGIEEQKSGICPDKDYSYLALFPKISIVLSLIIAIYFAYFAYQEKQEQPENENLEWLFIASILVLAAVAIKTKIIFSVSAPSDAVIEEVVE